MFFRDEIESVLHSDDAFSPVGYLNLKKAHLEKKDIVSFPIPWNFRIILQHIWMIIVGSVLINISPSNIFSIFLSP